MSHTTRVTVRVNGADHEAVVDDRLLLSDFLRHVVGATGTHVGCEQGSCGACSVLVDGLVARACLVLAVQADGHEVTTVEGLEGPGGALSDLQRAFVRRRALQCGFCTPGFLVTAAAVLPELDARATREEVAELLGGNLCRCTGYGPIVDAVLDVARAKGGR